MKKHKVFKRLFALLFVTLFTTATANAGNVISEPMVSRDRSDAFFEEQARSIEAYNQIIESFKANSPVHTSRSSGSKTYPDYYGGAYIDSETGGLVILVVDSTPRDIANLAAANTAKAIMRYEPCSVSFNDLVDTVNIVTSKIDILRAQGIIIDTVCDDIMAGKVIVAVRNLDDIKEETIRSVTNCHLLTFEDSQGTVKSEALGGGAELTSLDNGATSTLCFAARLGNVRGYVISGHAGNMEEEEFSHNGDIIGEVQLTAYYNGTTADAAFVPASSNFTPSNILVNGSKIVDASSALLPIGTIVYKYGKSTYLTSGEIKSTVASITYDGITIQGCYTATYSDANGDSGAPVMVRTGTASDGTIQYRLCGIHSGTGIQVAYRRFFSPYANIVNELGVTCITS